MALPEAPFDMDGPGHYFRRIKTVALSIPCVTDPYTSVNCTLTLLKSSIRKTQVLRDGVYAREDAEDDRFNDYFDSLQSIVTSSAQNDSGLFEPSLRDERYLPFEGAGVISEWRLELPKEFKQFDYDTISDMVLHVRYTARDGGSTLKDDAVKELGQAINEIGKKGLMRLFSARHEFPTSWYQFLNAPGGQEQDLTLDIAKERFPFFAQGMTITITHVELFADMQDAADSTAALTLPSGAVVNFTLKRDLAVGSLHHDIKQVAETVGLPSKSTKWTLREKNDRVREIMVVCHYSLKP